MTREELKQKLIAVSTEAGHAPDGVDMVSADKELASVPDNVLEALSARIPELEASEDFDATSVTRAVLDSLHMIYFIFTPVKEQEESIEEEKADTERAAKKS